jgi:hypothetical protein
MIKEIELVTVTLAVECGEIEEGFTPVDWATQELGWLNDSGIYLVEIKEIENDVS